MAESPLGKSLGEISDSLDFQEESLLVPVDKISGEPFSREQMNEAVTFAFNKTCDKLENVWNKIGFSNEVRNQRSRCLVDHVEGLLKAMVSEEEDRHRRLKRNIEKYGQEIFQLSDELGMAPYEPDKSMVIFDLEKEVRKRADELSKEKNRRTELLKTLKEDEKHLCERLTMPPLSINVDVVPNHEELKELEQHIAMLLDEKESRFRRFVNHKREISTLLEELEMNATSELERNILFEKEEQFLLSEENLASCKVLLQNLKSQKLNHEKKAGELRKRLTTLWQYLRKDEVEKRTFMDMNDGCKPSVIQMLQREVDRCTTIRKQNIKLYVENSREALKELWKKCCRSEEQMAEISLINDDSYTELLLDLHEAELEVWNRYYDQHAEVLSHVMKFENLWTSYKEFEARPKDPNRFANRGGALLQEEKERKKLEKDLWLVEHFLLKRASAYKKNGEDFPVWGMELTEYVTEKRESYNSEKKKQQEEKKTKVSHSKRSRADTPDQCTAKRQKYGAHLTVPSTSSATGGSTSRKHRISPRNKERKASPRKKSPSPRKSPTPLLDVASYTAFKDGVPLCSTSTVLPESQPSPVKK